MIEIVRVLMRYENTPISSPDKRLLRPPLSPPTFLDKPSGIAERGGEIRENEKAPGKLILEAFLLKKTAASYSPALHCSTIGAGGLNFSVRNGKRWDPTAITT